MRLMLELVMKSWLVWQNFVCSSYSLRSLSSIPEFHVQYLCAPPSLWHWRGQSNCRMKETQTFSQWDCKRRSHIVKCWFNWIEDQTGSWICTAKAGRTELNSQKGRQVTSIDLGSIHEWCRSADDMKEEVDFAEWKLQTEAFLTTQLFLLLLFLASGRRRVFSDAFALIPQSLQYHWMSIVVTLHVKHARERGRGPEEKVVLFTRRWSNTVFRCSLMASIEQIVSRTVCYRRLSLYSTKVMLIKLSNFLESLISC